jgi:hypothetical protein
MNEQRTTERKPLKVRAVIGVGAAKTGARTVDIGLGGMALSAPVRIEPSTGITIAFDLFFDGRSHLIVTDATVLHSIVSHDEFRMGVRFEGLSMADRTRIAQYLKW